MGTTMASYIDRVTHRWPRPKRKFDENSVVNEETPMEVGAKAAILEVSPTVVTVLTHNLSDNITIRKSRIPMRKKDPDEKAMYVGSGLIVECHDAGLDGRYDTRILAPATLFKRTNGLQPHQLEVDVYLSTGKLYKGQVLACDFHYNLAVTSIQSDCRLQTAKLRGLDDVSSVDQTDHLPLCGRKQHQLHPHSMSIKAVTKTKILILWRPCTRQYHIRAISSVVCAHASFPSLCCKELLRLVESKYDGYHGGAVISYSGEVLGIMFDDSHFLPSNIISKWWNHYKCYGGFRRPWLGLDIVNLCQSHVNFLEKFATKFPNIATGILVTKVEKDSPTYSCGIQRGDVIVKCDGKAVRSKLEFFEQMWDSVGRSVELTVIRATDGDQSYPSVTVGETSREKFNRWKRPTVVTT